MRRFGLGFLMLAAALGMATSLAAEGAEPSDARPSLEYRPQRKVIPEPKAPTPVSPVTVFREAIGNFGIGEGSFDRPVDVALDSDGNFFVLDAGNNRVQMFDGFSNFKLAWGSYGSRNGQFNRPEAILVDTRRSGNPLIYVADTGNYRIQVFEFKKNTGKVEFLDTWGSLGSRDGYFMAPRDIVLDGEGHLWVLDAGNQRVQEFTFSPEKTSGQRAAFLSSWGKFFSSRGGGSFEELVSIAWSRDRLGYLYLLGAGCLVQQFQMDGLLVNSWPAVAPESGLCVPGRIEVDNKYDYVHVLDAGNGLFGRFSLDGRFLSALRGAERPFYKPLGMALNPDRGDVLIADTENNIVQRFTQR